jgi:hypothetical protein
MQARIRGAEEFENRSRGDIQCRDTISSVFEDSQTPAMAAWVDMLPLVRSKARGVSSSVSVPRPGDSDDQDFPGNTAAASRSALVTISPSTSSPFCQNRIPRCRPRPGPATARGRGSSPTRAARSTGSPAVSLNHGRGGKSPATAVRQAYKPGDGWEPRLMKLFTSAPKVAE